MASGWKVLMRRAAPAPTGRAADRPASAEQPSCICRNAPVTLGQANLEIGSGRTRLDLHERAVAGVV
jgi:hypothetical protein